MKESNAWVEEIIAKIQDILLSFNKQYRLNALNGNIGHHITEDLLLDAPNNINQKFDYIFDRLSESYA